MSYAPFDYDQYASPISQNRSISSASLLPAKINKTVDGGLCIITNDGLFPTGWSPQYVDAKQQIEATTKTPLSSFGSESSNNKLVYTNIFGHGFLDALHVAYDNHLAFTLRPQDIWLLILQSFATHVNKNAERFRYTFVSHAGKKQLTIQRDDFNLYTQNPWDEASSEFVKRIRDSVLDPTMLDILNCVFSTSTPLSLAVSHLTLMHAFEKYFDYVCVTACGIPRIYVEGTRKDWQKIISSLDLIVRVDPILGNWVASLKDIVGKIATAYDGGVVDTSFWGSIYKYGNEQGSGGGPFLTGWITQLILYDKEGDIRSAALTKYQEGKRLPTGEIPVGLSVVPFIWDYYGNKLKRQFVSGFVGGVYDEGQSRLCPALGWAESPEL